MHPLVKKQVDEAIKSLDPKEFESQRISREYEIRQYPKGSILESEIIVQRSNEAWPTIPGTVKK